MSSPRLIFIVPFKEMVETGERFNIYTLIDDQDALARQTARRIMECLPPIGYVRLYDAYIDDKICYAFMIGARKTPLERVSPIMIEQFSGLFKRQPDQFTPGEDRWTLWNDTHKLCLVDIILTRRGDKLTEYE